MCSSYVQLDYKFYLHFFLIAFFNRIALIYMANHLNYFRKCACWESSKHSFQLFLLHFSSIKMFIKFHATTSWCRLCDNFFNTFYFYESRPSIVAINLFQVNKIILYYFTWFRMICNIYLGLNMLNSWIKEWCKLWLAYESQH